MMNHLNRPLSLALLAAAVAACTGQIRGENQETGAADSPGGSTRGSAGGAPSAASAASPSAGPGLGSPSITGPTVSAPAATVRLARLSHRQYDNTIRDLLRLPAGTPKIATAFIVEPSRGEFDNNGTFLQVSPGLWLDYQRAAEALAEATIKDGKRLAAILPANLPADPAARARAFIEGFGLRAYRRPLATAEIGVYVALFNQGPALIGSGNAWNDGVQIVLAAMLQSPFFLYRAELTAGPVVDGKIRLDDYEVAAKLTYALVGSMPDDALFAAAAAHRLGTRDAVVDQVRRLLATPGAAETIGDFHGQLLNLSRYELISKDAKRFPDFANATVAALKTESEMFVKDVAVTRDKGLADLLLAPYTFVNAGIAPVYGVSAPASGAGFVRVDLDPTQRAGILTQVGFLAAYADGAQPQTILRGAYINHDILCADLPPPPDAFTLPPAATGATNRQRIEAATQTAPCSGCHVALINPPGFALEQYDAVGKFRTTDNGKPVDATGSYGFDGVQKSFNGGVELAKLIASSQQAHDCYARHWLEYTYGRLIDRENAADKSLVAQLGARSSKGNASVKALITEMVATDAFMTRSPEVSP